MSRELKEEILHFEGIKVWDRGCARSVVNLLTPALSRRLEECRAARPELFIMDEDTLRGWFKSHSKRGITATENQLRMRFWVEYEYTMSEEKDQIDISRVVAGICSLAMFYSYVTRPEAMAWILCTPLSYEASLDDLLNTGAARMREIMSRDSTGDIPLSKLQKEIYMAAENRKMGPVVQKIAHLHGRAPGNAREVKDALEATGDSIQEKRIEELKNAQKRLAAPRKNVAKRQYPQPPPVASGPIIEAELSDPEDFSDLTEAEEPFDEGDTTVNPDDV